MVVLLKEKKKIYSLQTLKHVHELTVNSNYIIIYNPFHLLIFRKENMPEIHLGAHTLKSHGVKVARFHMHDWFILLFLVVLEVILNVIEPFHRFVGKDMTDLKYPLKGNTVPFWAVPVCSLLHSFLCCMFCWGILQKPIYLSESTHNVLVFTDHWNITTFCNFYRNLHQKEGCI